MGAKIQRVYTNTTMVLLFGFPATQQQKPWIISTQTLFFLMHEIKMGSTSHTKMVSTIYKGISMTAYAITPYLSILIP